MEYRSGSDGDFKNIETFVWQSIFPAFNHPDLSEEQSAENDAIVAQAQEACLEAVALENKEVIVAYDRRERRLAGFVIADRASFTYPEISWLIVSRKYWGKGVADELLRRAINWLGTHKPIKAGVHYYLDRALRFFARYGFENTGEPAGEHLIPRILLIREAGPLEVPDEVEVPEQLEIVPPESLDDDEVHNPLEPDEDELPSVTEAEVAPLVTPEPSHETPAPDLFSNAEEYNNEPLEDPESVVGEEKEVAESEPAEKPYRSRYEDIEFEIDYGEEDSSEENTTNGLDFEFAFDEEAEEDEVVADHLELEELVLETEELSESAGDEPSEIIEEVDDYQSSNVISDTGTDEPSTDRENASSESSGDDDYRSAPTIEELRAAFKSRFISMTNDLFGKKETEAYWEQLQTSDFREIAERSLSQLINSTSSTDARLRTIYESLTEYFLVSVAEERHGGVFPQRLLRHQTQESDQIDLFTLINDYLDLGQEQERVDTDFITIAPKRLKNATKNFLLARPGERIYFLIDQSILGNLKHGFAFTDQAFYWKAMLQPNHVAYYQELEEVRIEKGAVQINGHFFDTGKRNLNLKIVLLLKRLARL